MKAQFTVNQEQHTVAISKKAQELGFVGFDIVAKRWFQKSYGNTYHSVYVYGVTKEGHGVLIGYNKFSYGYGDQYLQTACQVSMLEGMIDCANEYAFSFRQPKEALKVTHSVEDVNRKKDL